MANLENQLLDLKYEVWKVAGELRKSAESRDLNEMKREVLRLSTRLKDLSMAAARSPSDKQDTGVRSTEAENVE